MIFTDMIDEVKRRIGQDFSGDIDKYIKRWLNNAVKIVEGERKWKDLRWIEEVSTTDGTESYVLPYDYKSLAFVWHRILGYNYRMTAVPERRFVGQGFIGTTEGTPYWYRLFNSDHMLAQPSSASVITLVSSSNNDNESGDIVLVKGIVSGYPDYEQVTLNGTSSKVTTKSFTKVTDLIKAQATDGRITATSNSGAVTVGVIPAGLGPEKLRRKWIKFYYIPDTTGDTIYVHMYRRTLRMANDYDSPILGDDFDEATILKACQIGLGFQEQMLEKAKLIWMDYTQEIRRLKADDANKVDDWKPVLATFGNQQNMRRVLNFGASYPPVGY